MSRSIITICRPILIGTPKNGTILYSIDVQSSWNIFDFGHKEDPFKAISIIIEALNPNRLVAKVITCEPQPNEYLLKEIKKCGFCNMVFDCLKANDLRSIIGKVVNIADAFDELIVLKGEYVDEKSFFEAYLNDNGNLGILGTADLVNNEFAERIKTLLPGWVIKNRL